MRKRFRGSPSKLAAPSFAPAMYESVPKMRPKSAVKAKGMCLRKDKEWFRVNKNKTQTIHNQNGLKKWMAQP
jgi:hypothetical protein